MDSSRKTWSLVRRQMLAVVALAAVAFVIWGTATHPTPFSSAEVKFTDLSKSGLAIVPASCPSTPDYPGQCDGTPPPANKCTLIPSSYQISAGDSVTLSWSVTNGLPIVDANIAPAPGDVGTAPSGSVTVTPSATTDYVYTFSYNPAAIIAGGHCDATVVVGGPSCPPGSFPNADGQCVEACQPLSSPNTGFQTTCQCPAGFTAQEGGCVQNSCPTGQHAVGALCVCDDTGLQADANGQCTTQVCPTGYVYDPGSGQCVLINQCNLPPICSDSTHVLNQCSGGTTDCSLNGAGWACVNGACVQAPPPIASISAVPSLVSQGYTSNIAWTSQDTASCGVTGTNGDGTWTGTSGSHISSPIQAQTIYTLSCKGFDGSTIIKKATVSIIPNWIEN